MKICYLAHPLGGDVPGNLARAKVALKGLQAAHPDRAFIAPWIAWVEICANDDGDSAARELGLQRDCAVVARCDEFWMVGPRISSGMERERQAAVAHGVKVVDLTGPNGWVQADEVLA